MKIILFGATGTAGSEVVRQTLADPEIEQVFVVVRNSFEIRNPKVKIIVHSNFLDFSALLPVFQETDACIWCLGISQSKVSKEQYFTITYEYVMAAAKALLSVNPEISFVFLSGQGADSKEKSRILFARVKGQAENALKSLPFKRLYILRPAGIVPVVLPDNLASGKKTEFRILGIIAKLFPWFTISTVQLAQAMLFLVKKRKESVLLENTAIKATIQEKDEK
jgi:uncharacterized protein YbjT (DUF2867 family)